VNFIDPDETEGSSYKKASDLPDIVSQSPGEIADTGRMEAQYKDENLKRIDKELSRPGLSEIARKTLLSEKENLKGITQASFSKSSFIDPDDNSQISIPSIKGKEKTLSPGMNLLEQLQPSVQGGQAAAPEQPERNPIESGIANSFELWKDESLPAHLYNAQQKGVFNKPLGELVQNASSSVKNFSVNDLWEAVKKDPGKFATEMGKAVWADPYLLFAPMGLGGKVAQGLEKVAGVGGKLAGHAAEVGTATAGLEAPVNIAKQLDEKGFVDPAALGQDLGVSFGMGAILGGVLHAGGLIGKSRPADIASTLQYGLEEGDSLMKSLGDALEVHGVSEEKAKSLVDSIEKVSKESPDLEADFKKMREGIAPLLENEPTLPKEMTSKEALTDLGQQADEMVARRAKAEASEQELQQMLEGIHKEETPSLTPESEYPLTSESPQLELPFKTQKGGIDPEMLKWLGAGATGAALGGYLFDDKTKGAAIGAALAIGGGIALRAGAKLAEDLVAKVKESPSFQKIKENKYLAKRDVDIANQTDTILSKHESTVSGTSRAADRLAYAIKKLVPNETRRGELIHAIQEGRIHELAPNERTAAEIFQKEMQSMGEVAQKEGVIENLVNDGSYVTQLWKDEGKAKAYYSSVNPESRFAKDRLIPSYKKGMELGLVPKTLDLAEIARIYGQSIGKTIANKRLLQQLDELKINGKDAIVSAKNTESLTKDGKPNPEYSKYADYVHLDHPQMRGKLVNPEIAPSLSHVFSSNNVPAYLAAMTALSSAAKRGIFSFSGFHIKSLLDVAAGLATGLGSPKTLTKIPSMYRMIKEGKAGDFADEMMRAGLKIDPHSGIDMDNDVFRSMMKTVETKLDSMGLVGKAAALPIKAIDKLDKGMQFILWEYLHPSMKLAAASAMFEKRMLQNSKALNANPQAKVPSVAQIQREIADATNDLYGGINWRRVSDEVQNKYLHGLTSSLTNPSGLRVQRVAMLAPDWTVATARSGYKGMKALAKTFIPGQKLSVSDQMYRAYFLGSALLYATIGDALNLHFSGHHLWENQDPTYVDMGNGQKLQLSKHFMEPFHWIQHPGQTILNKMGYVPKEALSQAMGKEFITTSGGPPMKDTSLPGRLTHAAKGMLPITTQQSSPEATALGAVGFPIYGHSEEEKRILRRQREIERRQQRQFKQRNK